MSKPVYYLIRHGQTDYNAEGRLQGARDIPLNALGKSQAASNGKRLRAIEGFDPEAHEWVASPLLRTRQTMQLVRENAGLAPTEFRTEDRLIEVSFGDWEGFTLAEVEAENPGIIAERNAAKWEFRAPGIRGESYEMLAQRLDPFFAEISKPMVIVAHGGTIRAVFNRLGGITGNEAALIDIPQDKILRIEGTSLEWL